MLKWTINKPVTTATTTTDTMSIFIDHPATPTLLGRRSMGSVHPAVKSRDSRTLRRKSLGANTAVSRHQRKQNKENYIMVTPHPITMRTGSPATSSNSPFVNAAFREIGNLTPTATDTSFSTTPLRKRNLPPSPISTTTPSKQLPAPQPNTYTSPTKTFASTLPSLDIEYSPACVGPRHTSSRASNIALRGITIQNPFIGNPRYLQNVDHPLTRSNGNKSVEPHRLSRLTIDRASLFQNNNNNNIIINNMNEEDDLNMSSKALDDKELDQMIDDILQSTRKSMKIPMQLELMRNPDAANRTNEREREVRTPDSTSGQQPLMVDEVDECQLRRQRGVRRKQMKVKPDQRRLEDCKSPEISEELRSSQIEILANMNTPKDLQPLALQDVKQCVGSTSIVSKHSYASTPGRTVNDDVQCSSTPSGGHTEPTIRRCLRFPDSPDSMEDDSLEKRKSVVSSTITTTTNTTAASRTSSLISKTPFIAGSLDVSLFSDDKQIIVHVIRCKDLYRPNDGPINAYVKVILMSASPPSASASSIDSGFKRTAVQRNSKQPFFDHRFVFERSLCDLGARIQLSVWHRDREFKRSEFIGCISFGVDSVFMKGWSGTFMLQPQSALSYPTAAISIGDDTPAQRTEASASPATVVAASSGEPIQTNNNNYPQLSQTAAQKQKEAADASLFLRCLQMERSETIAGERPAIGRTPYTMSKQLWRHPEHGFGFSVVWTHPPRIERVEAGQSADLAGIVPGDFVCFVGQRNVVAMPEADVLHLIRAEGDALRLEIFRSQSMKPESQQPQRKRRGQPDRRGDVDDDDGDNASNNKNYSNMYSEIKVGAKRARVTFHQEVGSGIIV